MQSYTAAARSMVNGATPSFSIVLEWDNVRLAETARVRECLRRLARQIRSLSPPPPGLKPEVIVAFNSEAVLPEQVAAAIAEAWPEASVDGRVSLAPQSGLDYYQLKNAGARLANGEILIFLDSDVIPDEGWLVGMLAPFADTAVQVVTGFAYVAPEDLYSRAVALFWYYGLKPRASGWAPTRHFYANNLAFRRELFLAQPFPDCRPLFRGHCAQLAVELDRRGVTMVAQTAATVDHPPPNGAAHFVRRALCEGHDIVVELRRDGRSPRTLQALSRLSASVAGSTRRIRAGRHAVGLGYAGAAAAVLIATAYFCVRTVGEILTLQWPVVVPRYFSI